MRWWRVAGVPGAMSLGAAVVLLGALGTAAARPAAPARETDAALTAAVSPWPTTTSDPVTSSREIDNVPITMSDGVILEANEYIPTTCTAETKCPVILIQTPYGKGNATQGPGNEVNPFFYEHGYIEVVVDVRGTGQSEGHYSLFGPREQQDGAELAQWVANPKNIPASDGSVGLAGGSYSAVNQLFTVEAITRDIAGHGPLTDPGSGCVTTATFDCGNPTHITHDPVGAIFPDEAASDLYRDIVTSSGNLDASFLGIWIPDGPAGGDPAQEGDLPGNESPKILLNSESEHLEDTVGFWGMLLADGELGADEGLLPSALQAYPEAAYDTSFWTDRAPANHIDDITVPTFLVGGTYDVFQRGEPINYAGLALPPSEKKLLIGPWYHITAGTGLPATDVDGNTIPDLNTLMIDWFDHWLHWPKGSSHASGATNGINEFPTVESYDLGPDTWVPSTQYPAPGTTGQRWYLGPDGTFSTTEPAHSQAAGLLPTVTATGTCSRSTWQWTMGLPTEVTEPFPVCEDNSSLSQVQGLTFTSAPMAHPYTMMGPIEADIFMSSTARDSTVIATLSDVSSSGASDITAGTLVASMRAVTSTPCQPRTDPLTGLRDEVVVDCTQYLDGQSINPWHPYTEASQVPLTPGRVTELRIEVFPTHATIEPGQRLRLTITTSDVPHELQTVSTTTNALGIDTFYVGGDTPSSVYLGTLTPGNAG